MSSTKGKKKSGTRQSKTGLMGKLKAKRVLRLRSGLEDSVQDQLIREKIEHVYEDPKSVISYNIPASNHTYTPDFVITTATGKSIIIETKGIWDYDDRYKHLLIRQQHPGLDIRFVFQRPNQRIKRGSETTYRDICEGRGRGMFKGHTWKYSAKRIPEEWFNE